MLLRPSLLPRPRSPIIIRQNFLRTLSTTSCGKNIGGAANVKSCDKREAPPSCSSSQPAADDSFWTSSDHWRRAAFNTSRCLVGCSIGDLSTLYALQSYEVALPVAVAASCAAGIFTSMALETVVLRATEDLQWRAALRTAAGMSLLSMVSMELAENAVELYLVTDGFTLSGSCVSPDKFWAAVPPAMVAGWLVPLPYNYYMLRKYGRGCH